MPTKKFDNVFEKIVSQENIWRAYKKSRERDGKYHPEAIEFAKNETYNLAQLRQSLIDETYTFDGYIRFAVYEPKERIVDAPHYKDKIVQLAMNYVLKEIFVPSFIADTYACIDGRGTHKCADRLQHFLRKAKWQYGTQAYIVKVDFQKFFYTIDRTILKNLIRKKIACTKTLRLLDHIIDSADAIDKLGVPLGNTISQIAANLYASELDKHCKRRLGIRCYLRYMDDIVCILPTKTEANATLQKIRAFAKSELDLTLNKNKSKIFPVSQGVNAIGFKTHATHRLLRNNSKKKIKRKVKAMPHLIQEGKLTIERAEQMLNSWLGHAKHASSHGFIKRLIMRHRFLCISKGKLKVRREVICNSNSSTPKT